MTMKLETNTDGNVINADALNRKLESFVEVVLQKMIDLEKDNKELKKRLKALERNK